MLIVLKIAMRNILRRPRRSSLLAALGIVGTVAIFFAESIFGGTERGLRVSYAGSLTSDFVIAAYSPNTTSIFGNDLPMVGDYFVPPSISNWNYLQDFLTEQVKDGAWSPVVSSAGRFECGEFREGVQIFGIDSETYPFVCPQVDFSQADFSLLSPGRKGISLPVSMRPLLFAALGRELEIGEQVQVSYSVSGSFKIETGVFAGFHSFVNNDSPFDKIAFSDPLLPRQLLDFSIEIAQTTVQSDETSDDLQDIDDLFDSADDFESSGAHVALEDIERALTRDDGEALQREANADLWNFVLVKSKKSVALQKFFKKEFEKNGQNLMLMDWKMAAGLPAQSAFALQAVFSAGVFFVLFAAVLVLTNGLTISVLERIGEIGTMRAIGARRSFVAKMFFAETFILVISSVALGILAGVALCSCVAARQIALPGEVLREVFGGKFLTPVWSWRLVAAHFVFAVAISFFAWVYPVSIAFKVSPVQVMGKAQ